MSQLIVTKTDANAPLLHQQLKPLLEHKDATVYTQSDCVTIETGVELTEQEEDALREVIKIHDGRVQSKEQIVQADRVAWRATLADYAAWHEAHPVTPATVLDVTQRLQTEWTHLLRQMLAD